MSDSSANGGSTQPRTPRYSTLQDYLRVLRRHRVLIFAFAALFTAGGLAIAFLQTPTYKATAQVSFRDIADDLVFVGADAAPEESPQQRAATNAELVTRPQVTRRVKQELDSDLPEPVLRSAIEATVGVQTNLVNITANSDDPQFAADLANEYAQAVKRVGTREAARRLDAAQESVTQQISEARANPEPGIAVRINTLAHVLSRIETLKGVATPVEIASAAITPGAPASPNPARNGLLGGVIGLLVGLFVAFGRDLLDRRLHNTQEVHEELELPVLARIGATAFGYPWVVGNGTVPLGEDFEPFRVLRTNLGYLQAAGERPLRSVVVTSGLPEEGKSTVSMSLATAAALAGQRTLLVECDLRRPSFSRRLGITREPGLSDYLMGHAAPRDVLQSIDLKAGLSSNGQGGERAVALMCISAGSPVETSAELLTTERFGKFVAQVSKVYDLVVLDSSPLLSVADPLAVIPHVDAVLLCVRLQRATREELRAARSALDQLPERPMGAVVTGLKRGHPDAYDYYYGY